MEVHRGEVFYADLSPVVGSEQGGVRPVLIIQNDIGNRHSPTVIAAAITSRQDKNRLPTHIGVRANRCGLAKDSIVLTEQIRTLDKRRLRERAGAFRKMTCAAWMKHWAFRWGCTTSQWPKAPIWTADIFENQISSSRMAFCTIMPLGVSRRVSPSSTA